MSDSQAYEYRAFLLQIADKLSQEDSEKIAFLEDLPSDMGSKPPLTLLMQLEMRGRVSASRPDDLMKILKAIERHDLAEKVKDFAKQQKKGRPTAQRELELFYHTITKLNASLQVSLLRCKILLQQVVNLWEEAERLEGCKRVEEVVEEAYTRAEKFHPNLMNVSKLMQEEQGFCREKSSESNFPSPDLQLSSLYIAIQREVGLLTQSPTSKISSPFLQLAGCICPSHRTGNLTQPASLTRSSQDDLDIQVQPQPDTHLHQQQVTGRKCL